MLQQTFSVRRYKEPGSGLLVKPSVTKHSGRGTHWRELESSRLLRQMLFSHSRSD
jgi:hypothetical protein